MFVLVSLHVKNLAYWGSYSLDTCLWYAQIDYLGRYGTNSKVASLFVEIFCQKYTETLKKRGFYNALTEYFNKETSYCAVSIIST